MTKETLGPEEVPVFYFLTIESPEKASYFREEPFRTRVEQLWSAVLSPCISISAEEYALNDSALHAVLGISGIYSMVLLEAAVAYFRALTQDEWGSKPLWAEDIKLRRIETDEELKSLRDFVVQKMLGGKELTDLFEEE